MSHPTPARLSPRGILLRLLIVGLVVVPVALMLMNETSPALAGSSAGERNHASGELSASGGGINRNSTATPTATRKGTPAGSLNSGMQTETAIGLSGAAVAPTPADPSVIWDARLPALNVSLQPANVATGTWYWKLIRADYNDPYQHCGDFSADHDMFFVLIDEQGGRVVNQHVWQSWPDGKTDAYSDMRGIADIAIWSNYDPANGAGPYNGYVDGLPSDVVAGMGLPLKHHVSFVLYFQKTLASPYATRTPTPSSNWSSPVPTYTPTLSCSTSATVTSTPSIGVRTATPTATQPSVATRTFTPTRTPTRAGTPAACTITSLKTINVGVHPKGVAVDPATNRVFVGLADSASVAVINAQTNQVTATWATDGQGTINGIAFSQNKLFISKRNNASVSVLDATTGAFVKNIAVGSLAYGVGASDTRVWVANYGDNSVSLIDVTSNSLLSTQSAGVNPALVAVLNDRAYVTAWGTGLLVIDNSNTVLKTISLAAGTFGVAANPATNRVYVSNRETKALSAIDAISNAVVSTLSQTKTPYGLAINPNTNHLFTVLADAGDNLLRVREADSWNLVGSVNLGVQGDGGGDSLAVLNNRAYIANNADGTVSVIGDCVGNNSTPTPAPTGAPKATSTRTPTNVSRATPTRTPTIKPTPANLRILIYLPFIK